MDTPLPHGDFSACIISYKTGESENRLQNSKQKGGKQDQDRSALVDITNDSPIVGLATGAIATPKSVSLPEGSKKALFISRGCTPGSGESILRDQVKTLLKKVEDDGKLPNPGEHVRLVKIESSAAFIIPPTPANTPIIDLLHPSPKEAEDPMKTQKMEGEEEESMISRSLLQDFSKRCEIWDSPDCPSGISFEEENELLPEKDENGEEGLGEEKEDGIEEICMGMARVSVREKKYEGRHTRFVYDSEGEEITGEVLVKEEREERSLVLRGLPVPTRKHLRFHEEDEEEGGS